MDYSNQSNPDYNQQPQSAFDQIKPKPENNLVLAIIATVLGVCSPCCIGLILGIVSIVFSTQVDSKYNAGDYAAAEQAAKNSKLLAYIAFGLVALNLIYVIFVIATQGFDAITQQYDGILQGTGSIDD